MNERACNLIVVPLKYKSREIVTNYSLWTVAFVRIFRNIVVILLFRISLYVTRRSQKRKVLFFIDVSVCLKFYLVSFINH